MKIYLQENLICEYFHHENFPIYGSRVTHVKGVFARNISMLIQDCRGSVTGLKSGQYLIIE